MVQWARGFFMFEKMIAVTDPSAVMPACENVII
jgi:hypothetical protein